MIWDTVSSIRAVLRSFNHRWQLKLLIVGIVTFLSSVPFSISQDFFVELNNLMNLVSILRILLIVWLILNDSINLRVVALHEIDGFQAVTSHMSCVSLATILIFHIELREVVLPMNDGVSSIIAVALLLWLHWMKVVVSTMTVASLSHSSKLICWARQLS